MLRNWRDSDRAPFAALNADPEVMRFSGPPMSRAAVDAWVDAQADRIECDGWGLWAVEVRSTGEFVGFVGLSRPRFTAAFTPCVEVGCQLVRRAWGHGYATEGGWAALAYGFGILRLGEIVSFTVETSGRSRAVMERLGTERDPADAFDHPAVPEGSPLRRHVLCRISAERWRTGQ